jgi:hypothetical protein
VRPCRALGCILTTGTARPDLSRPARALRLVTPPHPHPAFNQEGDCLAVGTPVGFTLLHTRPLKETLSRDLGTGLRVCEMLYRTNLLAVVGNSDKSPAHKVLLWDDATRRCAGELNFKSDVKAVRLLRGLILVVLAHKVYVYDFSELRCVDGIETLANPKGLCALSTAEKGAAVLACPGLNKGGVRVEWFDAQPASGSSPVPRIVKDPARRTRFLTAHDSPLAALALTPGGERLATASEKGTLVRVFSTQSGAQIWELRRGLDTACIWSIAWSPDGLWCAATSDKGTAHVWDLPSTTPEAESREGSNGALALVRSVLPASASARRYCLQIRINNAITTLPRAVCLMRFRRRWGGGGCGGRSAGRRPARGAPACKSVFSRQAALPSALEARRAALPLSPPTPVATST